MLTCWKSCEGLISMTVTPLSFAKASSCTLNSWTCTKAVGIRNQDSLFSLGLRRPSFLCNNELLHIQQLILHKSSLLAVEEQQHV